MIEMLPLASSHDSSSPLPVILLEDKEHDFVFADFLPVTTAFGGFKTWPRSKSDFILVAECSEISGPNPIFTVPTKQHLVRNLNALCIRLLSTDYQEFGSTKDMTIMDAQVLLPDIMPDVHAAVNHFTLYDSEARGFVRPFCIAYVTADKYKLLQLSEAIFKCLADASSVIQHSNRTFCVDGLEKLMLDLELTKSTLSSHSNLQNKCANPEERLKVYNRLIESCMKDIQQILASVKNNEGVKEADQLVHRLIYTLNQKLSPLSLEVPESSMDLSLYEPKQLKIPLQQNFDKQLRNLYRISPGGIVLSIYHLCLIQKHFKRKYASVVSSYSKADANAEGSCLYFGACFRMNYNGEDSLQDKKCSIKLSRSSNVRRFSDARYFDDLDAHAIKNISDILEIQNALINLDASPLTESGANEDASTSLDSACNNSEFSSSICDESVDEASRENCVGYDENSARCSNHIVPLNELWDITDHLRHDIPDSESIIVEIFRLIGQTESLLYSLLTRNLVVIFFSVGEELLARILLRVLATLTPRNATEDVFVEHNRRKPLLQNEVRHIAAVSYCLPCQLSDVMPANLKSSVAVFNISEGKFHGPKYSGCLLQDVNSSIKRLTSKDPILPFFISIFSEVELQLKLWREILKSSPTSSISALYLLQRDFTRCDIKIIEDLSIFCDAPRNTT